jgi:hypothetical protein
MALQYSIDINQARLDQVESVTGASALLRIFSGAQPANCAAADSGTLLCTITLPADWMAAATAASPSVKSMLGSWTNTASGGAAATPTHFRIWNSGASACKIQGTAGIGSGDLQVNGTITTGQTVNVTSFAITGANS